MPGNGQGGGDRGTLGAAMKYLNRSGRPGDNASADALIADAAFGAGDITVATALSERVTANTDVDSETLAERSMSTLVVRPGRSGAGETEFRRLALVAAEAGLTEWRIKALVRCRHHGACPTGPVTGTQ